MLPHGVVRAHEVAQQEVELLLLVRHCAEDPEIERESSRVEERRNEPGRLSFTSHNAAARPLAGLIDSPQRSLDERAASDAPHWLTLAPRFLLVGFDTEM